MKVGVFEGIDCAAARLALRVASACGLRIVFASLSSNLGFDSSLSPSQTRERPAAGEPFSCLAGGEGFELSNPGSCKYWKLQR